MPFFELAAFAAGVTGTELAKACVTGLVGNRMDAGAVKFAEDAVRRLGANTPPENHHVLKAMHVAFIGSLEQMVRACDAVGGTAADNFSRKQLQAFVASRQLRKLDIAAPVLPVAELEEQVRAIYGHQDAGPCERSCAYVIALVQHHVGNALSEAHQEVFYKGHGRFLNWADYFDLFFAAQIKANDNARRILMFERANELINLASEQAALLEDCRELLNGISGQIDELQGDVADIKAALSRLESSQRSGAMLPGAAIDTLQDAVANDRLTPEEREKLAAIVGAELQRGGKIPPQLIESFIRNLANPDDSGLLSDALRELRGEQRSKLIDEREAELIGSEVHLAARYRELASYAALETPGRARDLYAKATQLDPTDLWSWIELGRLRAAYDGLQAARNCFKAALQYAVDERNLGVIHHEFGALLMAEGRLAEARSEFENYSAITQRLAASDPGNAGWQRDLWVSHNKIGEVAQAEGDRAAARSAYEAGLAIAERLTASDPGNAEWQRDLSVSHVKIGDVAQAEGDLAAARSAYEAGLAIRERLANRDPGNAVWQRDVWVSYWKMAQLGDPAYPWSRVLAKLEEMHAAGTLAPVDMEFLERARRLAAG